MTTRRRVKELDASTSSNGNYISHASVMESVWPHLGRSDKCVLRLTSRQMRLLVDREVHSLETKDKATYADLMVAARRWSNATVLTATSVASVKDMLRPTSRSAGSPAPLPKLESLILKLASCSNKQLEQVLKLASPKLKELALNCGAISSLAPLSWCSQLRSMHLELPDSFPANLDVLHACGALKELEICVAGCSLVTKLAALHGCTQLESVHLCIEGPRDRPTVDLAPLEGFHGSLKSLELSQFHRVPSLAPLKACSQLVTVRVTSCYRLDGLDLTPCSRLLHLEMSGVYVFDLTPVASCSKLQEALLNFTAVRYLDPLKHCRELQNLELFMSRVSDLAPLAACTQLRRLVLDRTFVWDLAPLAHCTLLEELRLNGTGVDDLAPLAACAQLQHLSMSDTAVSDLGPLAHCDKLQRLNMDGTPVESLDGLGCCTELQLLSMRGCRNVRSLQPLMACKDLRYLDMTDCASMSRSPLSCLPYLEKVRG